MIEPLRSLLEKLRAESPAGFILQNAAGKPLSLDSLNTRVIAPALKTAGLDWRGGYYPGRRGMNSLVTDTSKNALNSTGLLRHSTPITALKHYTSADERSVGTAMKDVEVMALELMAKNILLDVVVPIDSLTQLCHILKRKLPHNDRFSSRNLPPV